MRNTISALTMAALLAGTPDALAQKLGLSVSTGIAGSLVEVSNRRPAAGLSFEAQPTWSFRSGLSLGLGFRYTRYPGVPNRGSLFLDFRYTGRTGNWRPVAGLRAGVFNGGDRGGDDPYLGLEVGPVLGVEHPIGKHVSALVLGSVYGIAALFRDARVQPGAQVGLVFR